MDDDVEPERYYEWILWKLRKEKSMTIEYTIQKEKSETFNERISLRKENRNYLFHINSSSKYKNVWSVIPGKFTLAFSMAPEFYRIIYKKNPKKFFKAYSDNGDYSDIIDETVFGKFQQKN